MQFSCWKSTIPFVILDDGAVGRTGAQATGILAVHALILAHQPLKRPVVAWMLVELDQVPVVPRRRRHRLVGVVEGRLLERHVVPFDAGDFARLTTDARGDVDVLADLVFALDAATRHAARMSRDRLDLKGSGTACQALSSFTRKPLNSGVYAFGSTIVGDSKFALVRAVRPASSAMPR